MTEAARAAGGDPAGDGERRAFGRELLLKAAEALGRLTDNTILQRIVRKALEARDGNGRKDLLRDLLLPACC